jgi:hypothetical protein
MKAILEFNLPEERTEHLAAVHAVTLMAALDEADETLRGYLKHGAPTMDKALEAMQQVRGILCDARALVTGS